MSLCFPGKYNGHLVQAPFLSHDQQPCWICESKRLPLTSVCRVSHTGERKLGSVKGKGSVFRFLSGPLPVEAKHLLLSGHTGFLLIPDVPTVTNTLATSPCQFSFFFSGTPPYFPKGPLIGRTGERPPSVHVNLDLVQARHFCYILWRDVRDV